jgi:hypothetical protein
MTYEEIIQEIGNLTGDEQDRLLQLVTLQRNVPKVPPMRARTQGQDDDVIHAVDRDGNPCEYQIKDLIWNPDSYEYIKTQRHLFNLAIPELIHTYAGSYIIFENGLAIDSDDDRDILLDRICQTDFYKQRSAIYCDLVPEKLKINA